jgi:two-component system nitrogen regulation response regulator GlnG
VSQVWIADDDHSIRWVLEKALTRAAIDCRCFASGDEVLDALAGDVPRVLVTDIRMPGCNGLALLQRVKEKHPDLPVIIMTAYSDLDSTVGAFQRGAFEYLVKPFDVDAAVALVRRALAEGGRGVRGTPAPSESDAGDAARGHDAPTMLQSSSAAMQDIFRAIGRLASSPANVLITGESGTGKELVARALHDHSLRAGQPFIAVNAAAIPRDLLEAELFGHERGAFTGAVQLRRGRFEAAHGGTLFLDEIGDMSLDLQARLLRVLAQGSFYRVGGSQPITVDVRVVAATHQPLEARVAEQTFREDLYHRLNVIRLRLPALRDRREDIPALARLFLQNSAKELGCPQRRLSDAALGALVDFDYPGNVRQLENICHWITVMSLGQTVGVGDLPPEVRDRAGRQGPAAGRADADSGWEPGLARDVRARLSRGEPDVMEALLHQFEQAVLDAALQYTQGRRADAARRLGIGRNTFSRKYGSGGRGKRPG